MYSPPISAVPKPHSTNLRLINDHSAGPHSPNAWIDKSESHVRLDNLHDLGTILCSVTTRRGHPPCWLFKSDVLAPYRRWPMHPLWQLKQVVTIDGERHIDRCMVFGSRSSPRIWCTFMGLVAWIVIHVYSIEDLLHYMDDAFTYDTDPTLQYYHPHDTHYPSKQCRLLTLWDDIGLPHEQRKQVFGQCIDIIGFFINPVEMSFTMPSDSKEALIMAIRVFIDTSALRRRPLVEWQHLLGWINWGLNTFPLLKPGLQSSYEKIRGKSNAHASIYLNKQVIADLHWVADTMETSSGLFYFNATEW